jgi:hypothetical protein
MWIMKLNSWNEMLSMTVGDLSPQGAPDQQIGLSLAFQRDQEVIHCLDQIDELVVWASQGSGSALEIDPFLHLIQSNTVETVFLLDEWIQNIADIHDIREFCNIDEEMGNEYASEALKRILSSIERLSGQVLAIMELSQCFPAILDDLAQVKRDITHLRCQALNQWLQCGHYPPLVRLHN